MKIANSINRTRLLALIGLTSWLLVASLSAQASTLSVQLTDLANQSDTIDMQLASTTITSDNSCSELAMANTSIQDLIISIEAVTAGLTSPLTLTTEDLTSLDDLSNLSRSMANSINSMSLDINSISDLAELFEYQASLAAMLQLSDDIGTMADRILEMANKILIMADNIGLMADRILITMTLQNTNIALTQSSMLSTQQNMITLSGTFNTLGYNLLLNSLLNDNNLLSSSMGSLILNESNMSVELGALETSVATVNNAVDNMYTQIITNSEKLSHSINGDTLTMLGDLSTINKALAQALETYSSTINILAPLTSTPILSDATASMLVLTSDIGEMSNRIMEMVDLIIIMADNIGEMSARIVETQNIQQTNIDLTQNSLTTATTATVNVIAGYNL